MENKFESLDDFRRRFLPEARKKREMERLSGAKLGQKMAKHAMRTVRQMLAGK